MKKYFSNILKDRCGRRYEKLGGAGEACLAHNQKVSGSKPLSAITPVRLKIGHFAWLAQSVERLPFKQVVVGSSPTLGTKKLRFSK